MSSGWLVYSLLVGLLVALAACALDATARARRWPTRWIWTASMLATLLVTAGGAGRRPAEPSAEMATTTSSAIGASTPSTVSTLASLLADLRTIGESMMVGAAAATARQVPSWLTGAMGALWLASALAALATLVSVHLRLRRACRGWPRTELHDRRVRVAPTVGPAVLGIVRPEIVVPQWLLERVADEQRLVLAHEDEHVRARDHLLLGGACIAVALVPWHPVAWWFLARLRLAIELDCDARVLGRGVPARPYGEMLIDLAGQCSGFRVGATALADKTSHLERRLLAMRPVTTRHSLLRAGALCAAAALSLAAACEARIPTSAEIRSMDVASAERAARKSGLMTAMHGGSTPEFYVNDVKVSAAEAHAIPPNDIATVNVEKGKTDGAASSIRIRTVAATIDGTRYRTGNPEVASHQRSVTSAPRIALPEQMARSSHEFSGIILIDGVRADAVAFHKLDPKDIAGIEVVKRAAAAEMITDPAAKNGIIRVTLRTKG